MRRSPERAGAAPPLPTATNTTLTSRGVGPCLLWPLSCHTGLENAEFSGIIRPFWGLLFAVNALIDRRFTNNTVGVDSNGRRPLETGLT